MNKADMAILWRDGAFFTCFANIYEKRLVLIIKTNIYPTTI